ncbi:MAG TPA: DUF1553 domain-containing protein [Bryobacteraceae bacterium]|nr:DUF1553 domain-containing protein [Bryobacteraceae bacterium]
MKWPAIGIGIGAMMLCGQGSPDNCSFQRDPRSFLDAELHTIREVHERTVRLAAKNGLRAASGTRHSPAGTLPRRNFIDEEILGRLEREGIAAAPLTTDAEFVRRIYIDLAGRLPAPVEYRDFLSDTNPVKRDALIDTLLFSQDYINRWSTWLADLVQNTRTAANVSQNVSGRNAMNDYLRQAVYRDKSFRDLAWELTTHSGNNYEIGSVNWSVRTITPGGPAQDRYDTAFVKLATTFLGLGHYDCLACHNGRCHLEQLSLWGGGTPRTEAFKMAAHFARLNITGRSVPNTDFYSGSFDISDRATGTYDLNTTYGNRPNRVRMGNVLNLTPEYRNGKAPAANQPWRQSFADNLTADPMFARNAVNRIWKQLFQLGLAEPLDNLDPDRLDVDNPPPAPWTFQTAHPLLLKKLSARFVESNYSLRETIRLLVSSTAYQLSSRYEEPWQIDYVPLYARHYARRMEAEEIHDNLGQASGNWTTYTPQGFVDTVRSAWRLPDPTEPGGAAGAFMATFLRGNRDTQPRRQDGSILQSLTLLNDTYIRDRIRLTSSPTLRDTAAFRDNDTVVEQLFLLYLGREPNSVERAKALAPFAKATTTALRNAAIEDLAWVLVNKVDFLIHY